MRWEEDEEVEGGGVVEGGETTDDVGGVNALTVDVGDGTASGADDFADSLLRMHHHRHQ